MSKNTKSYEITAILDKNLSQILKRNDRKFKNEFDEFNEYFKRNYKEKLDNKSKIIPQNSYKIFEFKGNLENRKTGKFYKKLRDLKLGRISYCDYFFTFFNGDIAFGIKPNKDEFEGYKFLLTDSKKSFCEEVESSKQILNFSGENRAFKLAIYKNHLRILNSIKKDILDINNLKVPTIRLLSFEIILKTRSEIGFYGENLDEILKIKKSGFDYKASSDKSESLQIFNRTKEMFDIDNKKEFLEYAKEIFEIKRDKFYAKLKRDKEDINAA